MSFKEGLTTYLGIKYMTGRPTIGLLYIGDAIMVVNTGNSFYKDTLGGIFCTTFLRDSLFEKAEKDMLEGRTKRAYLEALGGGLSSVIGRLLIGSAVGSIFGERGALIGGIVGTASGVADAIGSFGRISRINPGPPGIPAVYFAS